MALGGAEGYPGEDVMRTMETIENAATAVHAVQNNTGSPTRHAHAEMDSRVCGFGSTLSEATSSPLGEPREEPREEALPYDPGVPGHRTSDQSDASDGPTPDATTPDSRSRASRDAIVEGTREESRPPSTPHAKDPTRSSRCTPGRRPRARTMARAAQTHRQHPEVCSELRSTQ